MKNYDLVNPVTKREALSTLQKTRMNNNSVKIDESVARNISEEVKNNDDETQNKTPIMNFEFSGGRPNYMYKKSMSQKLFQKKTLNIELNQPETQGPSKLIETQILNRGEFQGYQYPQLNQENLK